MNTVREKAFDAAIALAVSGKAPPGAVLTLAKEFESYLGYEVTAEAPKATRSRKATVAPDAVASEVVPVPAASPATTGQLNTGAAQPAATVEAVATAAKEPTLDDVRAALVALQTRTGTKAESQKILDKYSPTKVTGGIKKEDWPKIIAELNACVAA